MPYTITKGGGNCADDKWAVVNTANGKTAGCHDTEASAKKQVAALNANVDESADSRMFWEAKYSAEQLRTMLRKGQAMRNADGDPSYPIADEEDLRKAIHAVGRGGAGHDAIRRHIMKRARALGKSDMIPDNWKSSGSNESAEPHTVDLTDTVPLTEAVRGEPTGRRMAVQLITPGWGASGYYSEAVLKQAAADRVFGAGTSMYIDHQTFSEAADRIHGERSMKDLAARFVSDAVWNGDGLVAEQVEVFGPWREVLADMAEHIGVSIRSVGQGEFGEAEGRHGLIVDSIDKAISVDFVAEAGRGGKVLALLESKRAELAEARNVGTWLEAQLHSTFTQIADGMYGDGRLTREERLALSAGIGEALTAFTSKIEADASQLYSRDVWADPAATTGEMQESASPAGTSAGESAAPPETSESAPPTNPAETEPVESAESNPPSEEDAMFGTQDAGGTSRLSPRQVLESRNTSLEGEVAQLRARERARDVIGETLGDAWLTPSAVTRLTGELLESLPIVDGTLDEAALRDRATGARDRAESEVAEALEAAGVGKPRLLGAPSVDDTGKADIDGRLAGAFETLGLSESAAKTAVKGR